MSSLLPPCEPLLRSMPTHSASWRAPRTYPSTPSVSVHNGAEGEEGGVQGFLGDWQEGTRGEYSLVVRQSAVIQMPLFQMVTESLSLNLFPSLCIFSNLHFYLLYLFPLCLCFQQTFPSSLTIFSNFFFLSRIRPYISKSHFDCLVGVGFLSCGSVL